MRISYPATLAAVATLAGSTFAAPTIDGTRDAEYGGALAVQTVQTQFGDRSAVAGGSEWDAAYGRIEGGRLYLMLTGNLEDNFNKLEIFIDSRAGGQAAFDSSGNDNAGRMDGLVFDAGFTADYHLIARRGGGNFDLDFANLTAQSASGYFDFFTNSLGEGSGSTGTGVNAQPIAAGFDNSNLAGVTGGTGAADQAAALAVATGLELSISLADLGYLGGDVRVMVGQNGSGHDYWSNQFLGGLPAGTGNLGGDGAGTFTGEGAIDFTGIPGNQYFTIVVPEPTALAALALGTLAVARRRRR